VIKFADCDADDAPWQRRKVIHSLRKLFFWIYQFLASTRLAVALIATLAVVLACATFLEASRGREYVQWYVYHSNWFLTLLGLLAVNILAAALIRFPWSFRQTGFLITHAGLLILLGGSVVTFLYGIEGQVSLVEGDSAERFQIGDRSQFTTRWMDSSPRPDRLSGAFIFEAGPNDWSNDQALDLGALGGVQLKVLKFYRHARTRQERPADHARQQVVFEPATANDDDAEGLEPAALVEVRAGGITAETWLKCNDPNYETAEINTAAGPLTVTFGHERLPLGFSLKLLKFHQGLNPGGMGAASYSSLVQLIDPARGINQRREISMNEPLLHGQYTLYQSSFTPSDDGPQTSLLTVSADPALYVKYLGCLMICGGTLLMFWQKWKRGKAVESGATD
jgi:hypothetical protein